MEKIGNALFYCRVNRDDKANSGVIKKCIGQVEGFRKLGWDMDIVWLCKDGILLNDQLVHTFQHPLQPHSFRTYFFYFFQWNSLLRKSISFQEYDFVYMRYELSHPALIRFLKRIKKRNKQLQLILEIPTYPYEKEVKGVLKKVQLVLDKIYRKKLKRYLNFIVTYGKEKEIFGIQTLTVQNGISLDVIKKAKYNKEKNIRLIAVGNWSYWHGLDRLLKGLGKFYSIKKAAPQVTLHILGGGKEIQNLIELVKLYHLEEWVYFTGPVIDDELDSYFSRADLGVGDLASFRKGLIRTCSLKHREYCARGVPFFMSTPDEDFPENLDWVKYFENNNEALPIEKIIEFYFDSASKADRSTIRKYAENKLTWKIKLKPISNKIKRFMIDE